MRYPIAISNSGAENGKSEPGDDDALYRMGRKYLIERSLQDIFEDELAAASSSSPFAPSESNSAFGSCGCGFVRRVPVFPPNFPRRRTSLCLWLRAAAAPRVYRNATPLEEGGCGRIHKLCRCKEGRHKEYIMFPEGILQNIVEVCGVPCAVLVPVQCQDRYTSRTDLVMLLLSFD